MSLGLGFSPYHCMSDSLDNIYFMGSNLLSRISRLSFEYIGIIYG
jgi:hypothetical protein